MDTQTRKLELNAILIEGVGRIAPGDTISKDGNQYKVTKCLGYLGDIDLEFICTDSNGKEVSVEPDGCKLVKRNVLNTCKVAVINIDDELGDIEVYYRMGDAPKSDQTDECENQIIIECVKLDGEEITLTPLAQSHAYDKLYLLEAHNNAASQAGDLDCDEVKDELVETLRHAQKYMREFGANDQHVHDRIDNALKKHAA